MYTDRKRWNSKISHSNPYFINLNLFSQVGVKHPFSNKIRNCTSLSKIYKQGVN